MKNRINSNCNQIGAQEVLSYDQVQRLMSLLECPIEVHGAGNFPTLHMPLRQLVCEVRNRLRAHGLMANSGESRSVRINGSCASYVLADPNYQRMTDVPPSIGGSQSARSRYASASSSTISNGSFSQGSRYHNHQPNRQRYDSESAGDGRRNQGASSIMSSGVECDPIPFNDIDLVFMVDLTVDSGFDKCKNAVLDALLEFLPAGASKTRIGHSSLRDAYVRKLVKVGNPKLNAAGCTGDGGRAASTPSTNNPGSKHSTNSSSKPTTPTSALSQATPQQNTDLWSLISLNNDFGRYIELKFVHRMRRQYEFSVDSFQIHLDSYLQYFQSTEPTIIAATNGMPQTPMSVSLPVSSQISGVQSSTCSLEIPSANKTSRPNISRLNSSNSGSDHAYGSSCDDTPSTRSDVMRRSTTQIVASCDHRAATTTTSTKVRAKSIENATRRKSSTNGESLSASMSTAGTVTHVWRDGERFKVSEVELTDDIRSELASLAIDRDSGCGSLSSDQLSVVSCGREDEKFSFGGDDTESADGQFEGNSRDRDDSESSSLMVTMSPSFYPSVTAESLYGDFHQALFHLHNRLIDTRNPEEIRGGGLLKYCHLLVRGYRQARPKAAKQMERYMCSRFFIDFPDIDQQVQKLQTYVANHFVQGDFKRRYDYLLQLHRVVSNSTVCLMGHERRMTLEMVYRMAQMISDEWYYDNYRPQPPTLLFLPASNHGPNGTPLAAPPNLNYWYQVHPVMAQ